MASKYQRRVMLKKAKWAKEEQHYDDMAEYMAKLVNGLQDDEEDLTAEERHLLSFAYYTVLKSRALSMESIQEDEAKSNLYFEFMKLCDEVLNLLDTKLILRSVTTVESKMDYLCMKCNILANMAEFMKPGVEKVEAAGRAHEAFKFTQQFAKSELVPTHPARLGLELEFVIFTCRILKNGLEANNIIIEALKSARACGGALQDDSRRIMQDLVANLQIIRSPPPN